MTTTTTTTRRRKDDDLRRFVGMLPKVELHAHLNGCVRQETLLDLAQQKGVEPVHLDTNHRSLSDCFLVFREIRECVNDLACLRRITRETMEDFAREGVAYLELRTTPKRLLHPNKQEASKKNYIDTILQEMKSFQQEEKERYQQQQQQDGQWTRLPLVPRLIVSINREESLEEAQENVQLAIDYFSTNKSDSMVVGLDLGGNPTKNDFRDFQSLLEKARRAGLPLSIHCGEVPACAEDGADDKDEALLQRRYQELQAIADFRPDRLGHALLIPERLRPSFFSKRIPVECCPTSNIMTLELSSRHDEQHMARALTRHPQLSTWLRDEYPLSVSTDDPGVFRTDATREWNLVATTHNLSRERLRAIVLDSVNHAFLDASQKHRLHQDISKQISMLMARSSLQQNQLMR